MTITAARPRAGQIQDWASGLPPLSIFKDFTYISDKAVARRIVERCLEEWHFAYIDEHPDYGLVFHTLDDGRAVWRKRIAREIKRHALISRTERDLEMELARRLKRICRQVRRQVCCSAGCADIVTESAVYEVEARLTRQKMFEAVGQALLYRQALGLHLRAVVVGEVIPETQSLVPFAEALGIEVMAWHW